MKMAGQGKITLTALDLAKLPAGIKYEGNLKSGHRWTDSQGDHIVITTETGEYQSTKFNHESDGADAEIFAYHFSINNNKAAPVWKVYDYVSDCPVDITASFIQAGFKISDLNQNGIAEVWIMYKTACRGDVSPADMKLIMYENGRKHAMRGTEKILQGVDENSNKSYAGGEYTFDKAFGQTPAAFRTFAKKLWNENIQSGLPE